MGVIFIKYFVKKSSVLGGGLYLFITSVISSKFANFIEKTL